MPAPKEKKVQPDRTVSDPMALLTKAVVNLPTMMHFAVQSTLSEPTDPSGEGKMSGGDWKIPIQVKMENQQAMIDKWMRKLVPPAYLLMWIIMTIAFFAA